MSPAQSNSAQIPSVNARYTVPRQEVLVQEPTDLSPTQRRVRLLLALMRRRQATTRELVADTGATQSQIREDLKHLAPVAPIRAEGEGRHRHWVVDDGLAVEGLGILDRISLSLGRELTGFLGGTALGELTREVRPWDQLPRRYTHNISRKIRLLAEPARDYRNQRESIDTVLDALLRERVLDFAYSRIRGDEQLRQVAPLTLVVYRRALYLLARVDDNGPVKRFAIDRMHTVVSGEPFEFPRDYRPEQELRPWFGITTGDRLDDVHLRFTAQGARYARARSWHPTARMVPRDDGGLDLHMRTGGRELIRFCLEWGPQVRVFAPAWLRDSLVKELGASLAQYLIETGEQGQQ